MQKSTHSTGASDDANQKMPTDSQDNNAGKMPGNGSGNEMSHQKDEDRLAQRYALAGKKDNGSRKETF